MDKTTRIEIVDHAVRWANNIVVEVSHNHGAALSVHRRAALRAIVMALGEYLQPEPEIKDDKTNTG